MVGFTLMTVINVGFFVCAGKRQEQQEIEKREQCAKASQNTRQKGQGFRTIFLDCNSVLALPKFAVYKYL